MASPKRSSPEKVPDVQDIIEDDDLDEDGELDVEWFPLPPGLAEVEEE